METAQITTEDPNAPRIYVGTYHKYNSGNLGGAWLDLDDYDGKDSFYEACRELHKDEEDPEFMFQDFENFPSDFYGESGCDDVLWDWLELDKHEREVVSEFLTVAGMTDTHSILEAYQGTYESETDYAYQYIDDTGVLNDMPENLQHYFDYEAFGRDLFMCDLFITDNGFVFGNY